MVAVPGTPDRPLRAVRCPVDTGDRVWTHGAYMYQTRAVVSLTGVGPTLRQQHISTSGKSLVSLTRFTGSCCSELCHNH